MKNIIKAKNFIWLAVFSMVALFPIFVSAQQMTVEQIQAQINALMAQIKQLQAQLAELQGQPVVWCHDFNVNLKIGDSGSEVEALQTALGKGGFPIMDIEENREGYHYFGEFTAAAVVGFQEKYKDEILTPFGLQHGTGYVGSYTRAKLNQLYGCTAIPFTYIATYVIDPSSATRQVGQTQQFTGWYDPDGPYGLALVQDKTSSASWTSSDTSIATISSGLAICKTIGSVDITSVYSGITATAKLTCTAIPISAPMCTFTVHKAGTGSGTVTSSPSGIFCGDDCSEEYPSGIVVMLTAVADPGSFFAGWSGDYCFGKSPYCFVSTAFIRQLNVTATFSIVATSAPTSTPVAVCSASFYPATLPILPPAIGTIVPPSTFMSIAWAGAGNHTDYSCSGDIGSGTLSFVNGGKTVFPTKSQTCTFNVQDASHQTIATCSASISVVTPIAATILDAAATILDALQKVLSDLSKLLQ